MGKPSATGRSLIQRWHHTPLYLRILGALVLGVLLGWLLGSDVDASQVRHARSQITLEVLAAISGLVLRILGALAPVLILLAIVQALMHSQVSGSQAGRLIRLLLLNTLVAIMIGLLVANTIRPGTWGGKLQAAASTTAETHRKDALTLLLENVPRSLFGPLGDDGKIIGVIFIAVAFGIALRKVRHDRLHLIHDGVEIALGALIVILHWVIDVIPLAVLGIAASTVGLKGFSEFKALGGFVLAVLVALALQAAYYLVRVRLGSWVRPIALLGGTRDALVMAFSTASSTATMPLTYECLRQRVGLREQSARMGALVGANFNNDGTALYEAMAALFVAQMLGQHLSLFQQFMLVITSVVASIGAAGIPEAGLVTMTLVFSAVGLPTPYIALLLTVDWFLDRCRTTINVMGDMNVSCLLDGKQRETTSVAIEVEQPGPGSSPAAAGNPAPVIEPATNPSA